MSVHVAILDSGIAPHHPHLSGVAIGSYRSLVDDDVEVTDVSGHGTASAAAIADLCPSVVLHVLRVLECDDTCPEERLVEAFRWVLGMPVRLCNASLGIAAWRAGPHLAAAVRETLAAGVRVIAPASTRLGSVYPGMIEGVDAVVSDPNRPREEPELRRMMDRAYWFASPYPRSIPGVPRDRNLSGVSFAAANVTGCLARDISGRVR